MLTTFFLVLLGAASFILVLSFLVFFHELGHYAVGRFFGTAVERFSIGFGKPIYSRRAKSGTLWTVARIPLGGFVKFAGDAGAASNPDREMLAKMRAEIDAEQGEGAADACFHFKPLWQRTLIVLAGPVANFILAVVIFAGLAMIYGQTDIRAVVGQLSEGEAAIDAGLEVGDEILTINGNDASTYSKLLTIVALNAENTMPIDVLRDGERLSLTITPRRRIKEDVIGGDSSVGHIGMGFDTSPDLMIRNTYSLPGAVAYGAERVGTTVSATGYYIKRIFTGKEDGKALGGVARIAAMTGKVATDSAQIDASVGDRFKYGAVRLIELAALLSIGLGVANLMPIPVLDGGHLLFYGYEAIARRPLSAKAQDIGFRLGISVLLGLFVILTWNDIGYVRSLFS